MVLDFSLGRRESGAVGGVKGMTRKQPWDFPESWARLKRVFGKQEESHCEAVEAQESWLVWLEDPWCQAEVRTRTRRALVRSRLPLEWQGEIENQALLILVKTFVRRAERHVREQLEDARLSAWLAVVIERACLQALRRLRRLYRAELQLSSIDVPCGRCASRDLRIDLAVAVDQLQEPSRSVVLLREKGYSLSETAELLGLSYKQTYYALAKGLDGLKRLLAAYQRRDRIDDK